MSIFTKNVIQIIVNKCTIKPTNTQQIYDILAKSYSIINSEFILFEISNLNYICNSNLHVLLQNQFEQESIENLNHLFEQFSINNSIKDIKDSINDLKINIKKNIKLTVTIKNKLICECNKNYILIKKDKEGESSFHIYNLINFVDIKSFINREGDKKSNGKVAKAVVFNYLSNDFFKLINFLKSSMDGINQFKEEIKYPSKKYNDYHGLIKSLILDEMDNSAINSMNNKKLTEKLLILSYILNYYQQHSLPESPKNSKNEKDIYFNIINPNELSKLPKILNNSSSYQAILYKESCIPIDKISKKRKYNEEANKPFIKPTKKVKINKQSVLKPNQFHNQFDLKTQSVLNQLFLNRNQMVLVPNNQVGIVLNQNNKQTQATIQNNIKLNIPFPPFYSLFSINNNSLMTNQNFPLNYQSRLINKVTSINKSSINNHSSSNE